MLRSLILKGVGPADSMTVAPLGERFNLIAGDNGLGKSFLLDVSWWALTRTWPGLPVVPQSSEASITFEFDGLKGITRDRCPWVPKAQDWKRKRGRPPNPGLVIYARVDGSFSVWDPIKNYALYQLPGGRQMEAPAAYHFSPEEVLEGVRSPEGQVICRGLLDDWTRWQQAGDPRFALLEQLLTSLSEDRGAPMRAGPPARPYVADAREIPTIRMPYGTDVPVTFAAAGMQRVLKLAYLLTWAFTEHEQAASRQHLPQSQQVIVLFDEPETHLHPKWQRTLLYGLVEAIVAWRQPSPQVQLIAATHSPLVLASLEPYFDTRRDALWKLDLVDGRVQLERDAWHRRGDANMWLISDVFDLEEARSREAELALKAASRLMEVEEIEPEVLAEVEVGLRKTLSDTDVFWTEWRHWKRSKRLAS